MKVYISTDPFSKTSTEPEKLLRYNGFDVRKNNFGRKITSNELAREIQDADILIAGTEKITEEVFLNAPNLKLISRVGIGLDGIDFALCEKYNIRVAYTPDAPTVAVAELCVGLILDMARKITVTNNNMKTHQLWRRHMGMLLNNKTVGIIGLGRIGKTLVHLLSSFNVKFLVYDLEPDYAFVKINRIQLASKAEVLKYSDVISLNIPLDEHTEGYISAPELELVKSDVMIVNTARGGIIDEGGLYEFLKENPEAQAAIDVFEQEPYQGPLLSLENCLLTCHMGASTQDSRTDMEIGAVDAAIKFSQQLPIKNEVLF
ncbi:phosphoglycerate dehydrogenase [Facilibium subflavum]|uniref:phosphoglycerate dehydrogenase n=1 Tax=Facilibium subflavum TaxID=2219058 RepID=UPI000E64BC00|nr:phosphoglycerate dehydrogenase [Facilibium subflavum]